MWVQCMGREDPLEDDMATTLVFLPGGGSHGQRSLVGYSPWSREESDTTKATWSHKLGWVWGFSSSPHKPPILK